jgi:hypothetical protein
MTWYFDPSGTKMDLYDHKGTKVREQIEFRGSWTGRFPRETIFDVMYDEARTTYTDAGGSVTQYVLLTLAEATFEQIEEGTPD